MNTKLWAAPIVALLATAALSGTPAYAAETTPSSTAVDSRPLINGRLAADADTANRLIDSYWTAERMRAAVPVATPEPTAEDPELEVRDRPGNEGAPSTDSEPVGPNTELTLAPSGPSLLSVNASPGVGKIFFTNAKDGKNYVCSGSTINNLTKNMVSTAGHCIHGGKDGANHQNWMYAPLYNNGSTPHGKWAAKYFHTVAGWTQHSYSWWDFAFVNVWPKSGNALVSTTGGNAIAFNQGKYHSVTVLAYPAEAPYDGTVQIYCLANMYPHYTQRVKVYCGLTGGASGGPIFLGYNNDLRFGTTNGIVAYQGGTNGQRNSGPYFDSDVAAIYHAAKDDA